jgi:thiamine-monophosphate kinase
MLVEGRHFFANADPHALGHKALAVNLSALAAMGATPRAFTLALSLPVGERDRAAREHWLDAFSTGMFELADRLDCDLVGGDTTGGPLNICMTVFGAVPAGQALRRDGAQPGDDIYVSGTLGDARLALGALRGEWVLDEADLAQVRIALERPQPRVALGVALRGIAHAALDLSDGLAGDLTHILERSNVSASVDVDALPRSAVMMRQPLEVQRRCTIEGGDDYELCFTAPVPARDALAALSATQRIALTRIGTIGASANAIGHSVAPVTASAATGAGAGDGAQPAAAALSWRDARGASLAASWRSFDHFDE